VREERYHAVVFSVEVEVVEEWESVVLLVLVLVDWAVDGGLEFLEFLEIDDDDDEDEVCLLKLFRGSFLFFRLNIFQNLFRRLYSVHTLCLGMCSK